VCIISFFGLQKTVLHGRLTTSNKSLQFFVCVCVTVCFIKKVYYVCDHRRIFGSKSSNIDQLTDNSIAEPTTGPVNWVAARRDDYFTNWTRIARSDDNLTSRDCSVSWSHDQQRACSLRGSRDRLIDRQSEGDPISSFPIRTKTIIWSFIVINL